jgi:hypothetical protein
MISRMVYCKLKLQVNKFLEVGVGSVGHCRALGTYTGIVICIIYLTATSLNRSVLY